MISCTLKRKINAQQKKNVQSISTISLGTIQVFDNGLECDLMPIPMNFDLKQIGALKSMLHYHIDTVFRVLNGKQGKKHCIYLYILFSLIICALLFII